MRAQDCPVEWGVIPRQDLEMKRYEPDTNASAVILCDYIETCVNNDLGLDSQRHVRIKILNENGYSWATETIRLYLGDEDDRMGDIEGTTYFLDKDGLVQKKELEKGDIIKEKEDEHHSIVRFTMPRLVPGCIIEYTYTIHYASLWSVPDWSFQASEPVLWSEYRLRYPKAITFNGIKKGYESFTIDEVLEKTQLFFGKAKNYLGQTSAACYERRMVMKNVPALRGEPYITTLKDYYTGIDMQFSGYFNNYSGVTNVLDTWSRFVDDHAEEYAKIIDQTGSLKKQTDAIIKDSESPEEKVRAIYTWISQSITCDGRWGLYPGKSVNEILETKKGTSADIAVLFISMLQYINIPACPVILSTRENGKIQELYPIVAQFNHVIVQAQVGTKSVLLDATNPVRPPEILPANILGVKGLLIQEKNVQWVEIPSVTQHVTISLSTLFIEPDGSIHGSLETKCQGYANVEVRQKLREKKDLKVIEDEFNTESSGFTVDSAVVEGKDSLEQPIVLHAEVQSSSYSQTTDSLMYINPCVLKRLKANPFKSQNRKFDIDYGYCRNNFSVTKIFIPKGYELRERPRSLMLSAAKGDVGYTRMMDADSALVQMIIRFEVKRPVVKAQWYREIKELYANIVSAESEQIILAKKKEPTSLMQQQSKSAPAAKTKTKRAKTK
jgi:hypothetical protein